MQSREPLRGTRSIDIGQGLERISMARWTPTSPVGWRFGWITVVRTCQTTFLKQTGSLARDPPQLGFVEEPETNGVAER